MNFFDTTIDVTTHPAVVAPVTRHHVEVNPSSGLNTGMTPVSWPNYLGGGAILLSLMGMLVVATSSASGISRRQRTSTQKPGKVHQANVLKNLEHRIEVARARNDQNLIHLLEQERHQLG